VVARSTWHALRGAQALEVEWRGAPAGPLDSAAIMRSLERTARDAADRDGGFAFYGRGDPRDALQSAARRIEALYRAPYLAHAAMEPLSCTAQVHGDRVTVWVATQVPGLARALAARVAGVPEEAVTLHVTYLGGGFGRRLETDVVGQAVRVAMETAGRPVQLVWPRDEDLRHDFYRPAGAALLRAARRCAGHGDGAHHHERGRRDHPALDGAQPAGAGGPRSTRRTRTSRTACTTCPTRSRTSASRTWPRTAACRWATGARWATRTTRSSPRASWTSWRTR
jgi:CO/xanthine dehydrogenase Mo-binding subunit